MYTFDYSLDGDTVPNALAHLRMFALADKYDILSLQNRAFRNFRTAVGGWNANSVQRETKLVCDITSKAYESSAAPLCERLISKINSIQVLGTNSKTATSILKLFESFPDFGKDLARHMSRPRSEATQTACRPVGIAYTRPQCNRMFLVQMNPNTRRASGPVVTLANMLIYGTCIRCESDCWGTRA